MSFLNMILLGGAAAAVIPILIHLLHRGQFQIVRWGAMHLLRASTARKRRIRIEQLVLLAVRASILLALALCMARPVLTGMSALLGGAKSSVAVVLDNSLSMNARERGRTRLETAREEVAAMLGALPRGSEMFVVWMAGAEPPAIGPGYDPERVAGEMNAQRAAGGVADPAAALARAAELLAKAHYANREVLVVSDFQRVNWTIETRPALARSLELLKKTALPPRLTLLPVGRETIPNAAVEALSVARPVVGVGQRVAVRATVKNYGAASLSGLRVYFRVDGEERAASPLSLAPGQSGQVVFYHSFEAAGAHAFEAAIDPDPLETDNARAVAVSAWTRVPVLLAADDPGLDPRTGDSIFLQAALQPFHAAGETGGEADLFELKTASLAAPSVPDLSAFRVVLLANARDIPNAWINPLDAFVSGGGGLLIFPGDRVRADGYRRLFQDKTRRFLPAMFGNLPGNSKKDPPGGGTPPSASIAPGRYEHPALALFNDPRAGGLAGASIARWFPLQTDRTAPAPPPRRNGRARNVKDEDPPPPDAKPVVLARLNTGEPFLIERQYGRGRAIVCATACDDAWSNLPSRPFYLPLVQQLAVWLAARDDAPRTLAVGQPLAARVASAPGAAMLTAPDGRTHELPASSVGMGSAGILPASSTNATEPGSLFEYGATWMPGVYRLATLGAGLTGETIRFAVNPPALESEPALLGRPELEALAKDAGAKILDSAREYARVENRRRFGHELWKPLLALVLGLFFLELFLEQRFARRPR